jgi:hypothetical protein
MGTTILLGYSQHIEPSLEPSKHLITSQCPNIDAANNGDCPPSSHKLISAPELSKHLTISQCPHFDAINNGD